MRIVENGDDFFHAEYRKNSRVEIRSISYYYSEGNRRSKRLEEGHRLGIRGGSLWKPHTAGSETVTVRVYYRVSTEKQDFAMQDNAIRILLKNKDIDYESCIIYQDYGLSGTISTRPDYQKLLSEVAEHDMIVVYEFSRLWRDLEEQSRATKMLLALGVNIVSVADGELNRLGDTLVADIKGSINQFEVRRLRERTKAGIAAKQAKVAQGLEKWRGRGPDKQKRQSEGYLKEQARRRALKTQTN